MTVTSATRASPSFGGAADVARQLNQRLLSMIDVDHAAIGGKPEAHRGLLLTHAGELDGIVGDHLNGGVDLLDLDHGRHWPAAGGEEIMDVDGVLARHDAADA